MLSHAYTAFSSAQWLWLSVPWIISVLPHTQIAEQVVCHLIITDVLFSPSRRSTLPGMMWPSMASLIFSRRTATKSGSTLRNSCPSRTRGADALSCMMWRWVQLLNMGLGKPWYTCHVYCHHVVMHWLDHVALRNPSVMSGGADRKPCSVRCPWRRT